MRLFIVLSTTKKENLPEKKYIYTEKKYYTKKNQKYILLFFKCFTKLILAEKSFLVILKRFNFVN